MYRGQGRSGGLVGFDRVVADEFRELNELRRSRSLPEYDPTRAVVTARQHSRWCRAVRARLPG
ncbi:MAG TPA: hypothetical protein VMQ81_11095 [Acidimicrobiia bacterium]|nr:hypothetical protein [Acidimicrobiia bacterium]